MGIRHSASGAWCLALGTRYLAPDTCQPAHAPSPKAPSSTQAARRFFAGQHEGMGGGAGGVAFSLIHPALKLFVLSSVRPVYSASGGVSASHGGHWSPAWAALARRGANTKGYAPWRGDRQRGLQ